MNRIVDASVVIKWLLPEHGSEHAAALMREPLMAPDCLIPECLNALRKRVARGFLRPERAMEAAGMLAGTGIALEATRPLAKDILDLALRLAWPAYDCAYLALARKLDGVLITADERFVARCRQTADLAKYVRSLYEQPPMVQERPARPYLPRRRKAA